MAYQLTRRAANAGSYSDRTARLGKPIDNLKTALQAAYETAGRISLPITVTDTDTGLWGSISTIQYVNGPHAGSRQVQLSLPPRWAEELLH